MKCCAVALVAGMFTGFAAVPAFPQTSGNPPVSQPNLSVPNASSPDAATEPAPADAPADATAATPDQPAQEPTIPPATTATGQPPVQPDSVFLELNSAVATETGGCRLTVVTTNQMQQAISRAAWQVAIFDSAGVVQSLPVLDFGGLMGGKTKVAMFELQDRACTDIGRIVINDVAECRAEDGTDLRNACLSGLATQSRTDIDFGL